MKSKTQALDRRNFIKTAGSSLIAAAAGSSLALSAMQAHAAPSAVTQTKQTQAAITPQTALQMLKEGNTRFCPGENAANATSCNRSRRPGPVSFLSRPLWAVLTRGHPMN